MSTRKPYPSDVGDEEWVLVAPYLTLAREDAAQRQYPLREVFNVLRGLVRTGTQWRMLPNDLPPWTAVYQPAQRWCEVGVFEALVHDLRQLLRLAEGRDPDPSAIIIDIESRTVPSTPESGARAGYAGAKRRKGSNVHLAVDTLGHLLALSVTPASEQEREQVTALAAEVQELTDEPVEIADVDQGYTGERAQQAAQQHGTQLAVVKLPGTKRGFVLLPRRWVIERSFGWLARDDERLPETAVHHLHKAGDQRQSCPARACHWATVRSSSPKAATIAWRGQPWHSRVSTTGTTSSTVRRRKNTVPLVAAKDLRQRRQRYRRAFLLWIRRLPCPTWPLAGQAGW
ncbi:MAG: IS5 family transposase [Chloroflexi bacterium]|nr:IS5 family transposase [Chloroflexota bacterium]